jgi:hypothetical protein
MANVKITALPAVTTLAKTDIIPCVKDVTGTNTTSKITVDNLAGAMGIGDTLIPNANYTARPPQTTYVHFSDVTGISVGQLVKLQQSSTVSFHLVTQIDTSTSPKRVYLSGPALDTTADIVSDSLFVLTNQKAVPADIVFSGAYAIGGTTNTLINRETKSKFRWNGPPAKLVYVAARNNAADGGSTKASINVSINGTTSALTSDITMTGTNYNTVADGGIVSGQTDIAFSQELEVKLVGAGTDGDSRDLTVSVVFALEQ